MGCRLCPSRAPGCPVVWAPSGGIHLVDAVCVCGHQAVGPGKMALIGTDPCPCPARKQVLGTKVDAERDGVKVPTTLAEYCVKTKAPVPDEGSDLFYDYYYEDGEAEADSCFGDDDDSGNEES